MTHKNCGGNVIESESDPPYESDEYGIVPVYRCQDCNTEIQGDSQIQFIPENEADKIQIESITNIY